MKRVAVIGGGVAGMQTALRLAEQGVEPVIIEKAVSYTHLTLPTILRV